MHQPPQRDETALLVNDLKAAPEEHSKAANLGPRTQEVFASLGVVDVLTRHALPLHAVSLLRTVKRWAMYGLTIARVHTR